MMRTLLFAVTCASLVACSATAVVSRPGAGGTLVGVPVRVKRDQIVRVFRYDPEQDTYVEVSSSHQMLADQSQLYAVDVHTQVFASPSLHVAENPDNTLKSVQVTSSQNTSGAIDAATTVVSGMTTARTTNATAAATAVTAQNAKNTTCQTANAAAVTADQALATARSGYDQLAADATQELRDSYLQVIKSAQQASDYAHSVAACK
jgi:hypothetical protein